MPGIESLDPALADLAKRALTHWGLEGSPLAPVSVSENVVFRVESGDGVCALRIHRDGYHSLEELEAEAIWTAALTQTGFEVPEAIPTQDGTFYARVPGPGPGEARHVGLVRWIDGVTLQEYIKREGNDGKAAAHFERLGALQARLHAHSAGWTPPPTFRRHAWDAEGLLGEAPFWGPFWRSPLLSAPQRERMRAIRDALFEQLRDLPRTPSTYGMVHADLRPDNLMIDGDHLYVIDFDDAGFGWYVFDTAVSVYESELADPTPSLVRAAVLRGYRSGCGGEPELLDRLPEFLLVRGLMMIGCVTARPEVDAGHVIPLFIRNAFDRADALGFD